MPRWCVRIVHLACLIALFLACFHAVIFQDRQLSYRDAAHFYYPLYQRVQQEWEAGRFPLWEPEENAGMPLLGNPTAAVLYPGKVIYALLPYPIAAKTYTIAHLLLAAGTMAWLLRHLGVSPTGRILGALVYTFGMPVLFQYCNIVFLVGAAWLPLGIRACDRWLRLGRRWGLVELALVLACQTLGGDPETAYLLGIAAGGYALLLVFGRDRPVPTASPRRPGKPWLLAAVVLGSWIALSLVAAFALPQLLESLKDSNLGLDPTVQDLLRLPLTARFWRGVILLGWVLVGLFLLTDRKRPSVEALRARLVGLALAGGMGVALVGIQFLPTLEYTSRTIRAVPEVHELFPFSVEPYRLAEFLWPGVMGAGRRTNTFWMPALIPDGVARIWIPSLYLGAATILLALAGFTTRGGPPWRTWFSAIALVSVIGSVGMYASPVWVGRHVSLIAELIGPHDPTGYGEMRRDGWLADGFGSVYWLMTQILPGFRSFRYPSKLLTFTSLAVAGLAGAGWDRVVAEARARRRALWAGVAFFAFGGTALVLSYLAETRLRAFWAVCTGPEKTGSFGPFQMEDALRELRWALGQGSLVLALGMGLLFLAARRSGLAALLMVVLITADLAVANSSWVIHCEQALLDARPQALTIIEKAEQASGSTEPYRVHRMPLWEPPYWMLQPSRDRPRDFVIWERKTIQPKYAIPYGMQYTLTQGVTELYDYWFFFAPFDRRPPNEEVVSAFRLKPDERIVYYPRRGLDLWNTKYFVLPSFVRNEENRAIYTLLADSERVYPEPDRFTGPGGSKVKTDWELQEDWQVYRNLRAYPRAWVVHAAKFAPTITGLRREDRQQTMEEIIYEADPLWYDPQRIKRDPHTLAWIETDDPVPLAGYFPGGPPAPEEIPRFTLYEPQRVELDVTMARPGLLVLADVYYPGWNLTVDGVPTEILRTNRVMRGVPLQAGSHHVVFRYEPVSVKLGAVLSGLGLLALAVTALAALRAPCSSWGGRPAGAEAAHAS